MATQWFKMRPQLEQHLVVFDIAHDLGLTNDQVVALLYRFASWNAIHGKYGVMQLPEGIADHHFKTPGLEEQLVKHGWMQRHHDDRITLHYFTDISTVRKSLAPKRRREILKSGKCNACGSTKNLEVDHIVPISRGGSCKMSNLQPLCKRCNLSKGQRTMEEWLNDR